MKRAILIAVMAMGCGGSDTPADPVFLGARVETQIAPNIVDCELSGPYEGCYVDFSTREPMPEDPALPSGTYTATVEVIRTEGTPLGASLAPISIGKFWSGVAFTTGSPPGEHGKVTYRVTVSGLVNRGALVAQ